MSKEPENEIREPYAIEWLYDIAVRPKGLRVEACKEWEDSVRQIDEAQIEGPTAEAVSGLQGRMAKGEKLFQGNERKMDKLENTHLEELDENLTQGDMSKDKRMADAWSETEQLMREIRKSNGGDELSENVRSNIVKLYKTADNGKNRLNDAINDPAQQSIYDSDAVLSVVAYGIVKESVALGGVDKPLLDAMEADDCVEQIKTMSTLSDDVMFAAKVPQSPEFIAENVLNPKGLKNLSLGALSAIGNQVKDSAKDLNPEKGVEHDVQQKLKSNDLDKAELEKTDRGDAMVKVLTANK